MKLRHPFATAAALVAVVALSLTACSSSDETSEPTTTTATTEKPAGDTIRIGLEGPLTGDQKSVGEGMLNGAEMAATEINAKGGVLGKKIEIVPIDDAADPETGTKAAKAAIKDGLAGVVGPYNSGVGAKTLPLYIEAGLVPLRLTSADTTASLGYTLQPMTSQIAPVATDAITKWLKAKSVAIIFDSTTDYTKESAAVMSTLLQKAGVTVTVSEAITPGEKSYDAAVTKVAATNPDLVYVDTYYPEAGLIAKAMFDAKVPAKCLADFGAYDNGFIPAAGNDAAQACPVVGVPAPSDFPDSAKLIDTYTTTFSSEPGVWTPYTYDSVKLLVEKAAEAGSFDSDALTAAIKATSGWKGWTGTVAFDAPTGNRIPAPVTVNIADAQGEFHVDQTWVTATGFTF